MSEDAKKQYEINFILTPNLREEEINSFGEEIRKTIESLGGIFKNQEKPEKRKLAYPIKKSEFGYYLAVKFLIDSEKLKELFLTLKHKEQILRYMIVSVEEKPFSVRPKRTTETHKSKIKSAKKPKEPNKEIGEQIEAAIEPPTIEPSKKVEMPKEKETKLEDIDKKLDEILGV